MKKVVPEDAILIPRHAQLVFKGEIFEVFQWPQKMYDGSERTFEMLKRPDTVEVIVVRDDKILLVRDEQPNRGAIIKLPMGRVEPDESWETAVKREVLEEAGLECAVWKIVAVRQPVPKIEWFGVTYVAQNIISQTEQQLDGGEKIELIWRSYEEVRQDVLANKLPGLSYNQDIFQRAATTAELLALPEFSGKEIDI